MKRNAFIAAAMEELSQEVAEGAQTALVVTTPADGEASSGAAGAPPVTEVSIDQSVDAVAALMEKNSELATENVELQEECFDNDVDTVDASSDSVSEDLEEAVKAGIALEQLAHLAELTVKSGQANKASVASLAFALEQITDRAGLSSSMAALEDAEAKEPAEQTKSIGEKAKNVAKAVFKALIEGIKKIFQWVMNFFEHIFTRTKNVAEQAVALKAELAKIDESKQIDDAAFIKALRLTKNGGEPRVQFSNFAQFSNAAFFQFFNDKFEKDLAVINSNFRKSRGTNTGIRFDDLLKLMNDARDVLFTEKADGKELKIDGFYGGREGVSVTPELVGGVQMYLAFRNDPDSIGDVNFKAGLAPAPEAFAEGSIPVVKKADAAKMLDIVAKWMNEYRDLHKTFRHMRSLTEGFTETHYIPGVGSWSTTFTTDFLKVLNGFCTSIMPQLLQMNLQNSKRYIGYVKKSIAVSGAQTEEKK